MSEHLLEPETQQRTDHGARRRHLNPAFEQLVLSELPAAKVIDQGDGEAEPVELITFGTVREICPACHQSHLKLVLRQRQVRLAHLFCADCQRCFDAHYANGAAALTI